MKTNTDKYRGFLEGRLPMQQGLQKKRLNKPLIVGTKSYAVCDYILAMWERGELRVSAQEGWRKGRDLAYIPTGVEYFIYEGGQERAVYDISKTAYDFAQHLIKLGKTP